MIDKRLIYQQQILRDRRQYCKNDFFSNREGEGGCKNQFYQQQVLLYSKCVYLLFSNTAV
jgi:hypothetical protein